LKKNGLELPPQKWTRWQRLLSYLAWRMDDQKKPSTHKHLCRVQNMSPNNMSTLLRDLRARGLVSIEKKNRETMVRVTFKGRKLGLIFYNAVQEVEACRIETIKPKIIEETV